MTDPPMRDPMTTMTSHVDDFMKISQINIKTMTFLMNKKCKS